LPLGPPPHVAILDLTRLLGYPAEWADDLERREYARGNVWTVREPRR
jgi:hypothetical protein